MEDIDKKCSSNGMAKDAMHKTVSAPEDKEEQKSLPKSTHSKAQRYAAKLNPREKPGSRFKPLDGFENTFKKSQSNTDTIHNDETKCVSAGIENNHRFKGKSEFGNGNIELASNVRASANLCENQKGVKTAKSEKDKSDQFLSASKQRNKKLLNDFSGLRSNYETNFPVGILHKYLLFKILVFFCNLIDSTNSKKYSQKVCRKKRIY